MSLSSAAPGSAWQNLRQGALRRISRTLLSCVPGQSLAGYVAPAAPSPVAKPEPDAFVGLYEVLRDLCEQVQELRQSFGNASPQRMLHDIQLLQNQTNGFEQSIAVLKRDLEEAKFELRRDLVRQRQLLAAPAALKRPVAPPRADAKDFAASLAALEPLAPHAFRAWKPLLDVNADAYEGFPIDSCSVSGHPMAELFATYLTPLLQGAVLDIGCGPQPVPAYLAGYPVEQIAGLDPLPAAHPFQFHHGLAEFLPWEDNTFDVVIAATSLDHVLLLDRTFDEIRRVLRPGGKFVTWISIMHGAKPYQPHREDVRPIDAFHLFHFDRGWFEEMMAPLFRTREALVFDEPYNTGYYCFEPR